MVLIAAEQCAEPGGLLVGEQVDAGVQGSPGAVERVAGPPAVPVGLLLDAPSAWVDLNRLFHRDRPAAI